ncbi:hypothetical protein D1007_09687 [Hordeum vulgare]|nr:hypothetical protein D1007_09687 [Hordeum vulgare]
MARKNKGKKTRTKKAPPSSTPVPPPPPVEPQAKAPDPDVSINVLAEFDIFSILRRLCLADLLRAALACHRRRRLAARCLPRAPPLLGHFFHPTQVSPPYPMEETKSPDTPAVFAPLDASSPRLSLDFAQDAFRFYLYDSHQGLVLFEPTPTFASVQPSAIKRKVECISTSCYIL